MPLNSGNKTAYEEAARAEWVLGSDGNPAGVSGNPFHVQQVASLNVYLLDDSGQPQGLVFVDGRPRVSSTPYYSEIAAGLLAGHNTLHKFGRNLSVGATEETVWSSGGVYQYLTTPEHLQIASDDANDDDGDTGARTLQVYGLDGNLDEINETVTMNGVANVTTVSAYLRVFRAIVRSAGATGANEGTISISNNADTIVLAEVQPGENQTEMALWTVPRGRTLYLTSLVLSEDATKAVRVTMYVRPSGEVFQNKGCWLLVGNGLPVPYEIPIKVDAGSDIEFRAISSATGASVSAQFNGWYESD